MWIFLRNPISLWILWLFRTIKLLVKNRGKKLKIGYMTTLCNTKVGLYNTFYKNVFVSDSEFDDFVYVADGSKIIRSKVGRFCSIGPNVMLGLGVHPTKFISTFPAFYSIKKQCQITFTNKNYIQEKGNIVIGNDVWIGSNVLVLDNITIADGAIIAAGSVVTKNVDPYTIVGGVPARAIKKRFEDGEIKKLLQVRWWDKGERWIADNCQLFNDPDSFFRLWK